MRILYTTFAERPHFFPMVPLAWSCLAAGHEVRVASTPSLMGSINQSGLPAVSVGHDLDVDALCARGDFAPKTDLTPKNAWDPVFENLAKMQFAMCDAMVDDLIAFSRDWRPDVIVHDPVTFAGPVAAQVLGIPTTSLLYGMARMVRVEMEGLVGSDPLPGYVDLFTRYGVEPRLYPDAWIDPCPPSVRWTDDVALPAPRHAMRYVPYNGPGVLPSWLLEAPRRPRVCITWGTTQHKKLGTRVLELFGRVIGAIAELDVEVILTVGTTKQEDLAHLGELPPNVRPIGWVPFTDLVSTCSAVVHTGGTGVMMAAAAYGVPQLSITTIPEGKFNAEGLATTGAGRHIAEDDLPAGAAGTAAIRNAIDALLHEPSYATAARRLRRENDKQPRPAELVPVVERLAAEHAR